MQSSYFCICLLRPLQTLWKHVAVECHSSTLLMNLILDDAKLRAWLSTLLAIEAASYTPAVWADALKPKPSSGKRCSFYCHPFFRLGLSTWHQCFSCWFQFMTLQRVSTCCSTFSRHPDSTDAIQSLASPHRPTALGTCKDVRKVLPSTASQKKFARSKKSADSMRCHGISFCHILSRYPPPLTLIENFEDWHSLEWQWREQSRIMQNQSTKKGLQRCTHWNRQSIPCNADSCKSTTTSLPRPSSHIFAFLAFNVPTAGATGVAETSCFRRSRYPPLAKVCLGKCTTSCLASVGEFPSACSLAIFPAFQAALSPKHEDASTFGPSRNASDWEFKILTSMILSKSKRSVAWCFTTCPSKHAAIEAMWLSELTLEKGFGVATLQVPL